MDGDLFYRLLNHNPSIVVINEMLGFIRWHDETKSSSSSGSERYIAEIEQFRHSVGLMGWRRYLIPFLFRFTRLISGSYLRSFLYTLKYKGKCMGDVWAHINPRVR